MPPKRAAPRTPNLLVPPQHHAHDLRDSTPSPMDSPSLRTPKPKRFRSPPRTPLPNHKMFGPALLPNFDPTSHLETGLSIPRPSSSCSTLSTTSDSSLDTTTTYETADESLTSIEDTLEHADLHPPTSSDKGKSRAIDPATPVARPPPPTATSSTARRNRKIHWTPEMDAHLLKTYHLYQTDPATTPFFVLPGQCPPLGICCKVARETRRSWKTARLAGAIPRAGPSNRGSTNPFSFPASESAARRRLRELCRETSHSTTTKLRTRTETPRPAPPHDAFAARGMSLTLTTSTSATMHPTSLLAALATGSDIPSPHLPAGAASAPASFSEDAAPSTPRTLLPPLELGARSPYATFARKQSQPATPRGHRRRGTLDNVFAAEPGEEGGGEGRRRRRGYTISAGMGGWGGRVRAAMAPLVLVTGAAGGEVQAEGSVGAGEGEREEEMRRRLGSPFCERF